MPAVAAGRGVLARSSLAASLILVFTYVALSVGRVPGLRSDRLAATVVGAVLVVAFGVLTLPEAQHAVDGATLGLLFGMMLLSAACDASGMFALVGWWITRRARTPRMLLLAVAVVSGALSALLINDVVCIAFTPLVLAIAEAVDRDARPYLIALATSANIGSVATITGNPQNILIGSLSRIAYLHFVAALAPVALIALAINVGVIAFVYRRALGSTFATAPATPRPEIDRGGVIKSSVVLAGVVIAFIAGVSPAVAALIGASLMLLTRAGEPRSLYARVDWPLLALFTGLFIVVGGVEKGDLAQRLLAALGPLHPDTVWGLTAITALLSNLVSNVPAVMVLKSMVAGLPHSHVGWLVLAMASTLAGNLTLPGSLATIIVVERARGRAHVSFRDFLVVGLPVGLLSLGLGVAWLAWLLPHL